METNKNIDRLLEMLDHPERYSEQEIMDIVNHDEQTSEFYRQLVRAKRASNNKRSADRQMDVDEAWQQFERQHFGHSRQERSWRKIVAAIAGILLLSGIAWAAVHIVNRTSNDKAPETTVTTTQDASNAESRPGVDDITDRPDDKVVYDNVPLEQIMNEIAAHYGMDVEFLNAEARNLRFHFVWDKTDGVDKVLDDLNHFERVDIEQQDNLLIVQ
ncbi:MAG: DUF4974 domain-containing protein [Muribaculaceae bacterium]|nr:DUF4974 domain-containing protein [Muribaculaceae bacterium]